jgi:hypothetical protein
MFIGTGCATYQIVDADLLEKNKSKTFKLGIVKAAGDSQFGPFGGPPYIEDKKRALENIPIAEICSMLSSKYSITIDAKVDKTAQVVSEEMGQDQGEPVFESSSRERPKSKISLTRNIENAYYGNGGYISGSTPGIHIDKMMVSSRLSIKFDHSSKFISNKEFPDVVNVIYSIDNGWWGHLFYYDIKIVSSEKEIITARGIVERERLFDSKTYRDLYVDSAGRIAEALKKDLSDTTNASDTGQVSDLSEATQTQAPW